MLDGIFFRIEIYGVFLIQDVKVNAACKTNFSGRMAKRIEGKRGLFFLLAAFLKVSVKSFVAQRESGSFEEVFRVKFLRFFV